MISLKPLGLQLLTVSIALTIFAAATNDVAILATALATLLPLAIAVVHVVYLHTVKPCRCVRGCNQLLELVAGEKVEHLLELSCKPVRVQASKMVQTRLSNNRVFIHARFHTFGLHRLERLDVIRSDILGLVELRESIECNLVFRVYPRTIYWLERVLELLERGEERGGGGETGRGFIASSGEYCWSREYTPELPMRIDWKAYARTGELIVKVFEWPFAGEETLNIFYEVDCLGPITCDAIASSLLSLIVFAAEQHRATSVKLCRLEDGVCTEYSVEDAARATISILFRARILQKLVEVYEYVDPLQARRIQQLLQRVKKLGKPIQGAPTSTTSTSAVIVSTLVAKPSKLVERVEKLRASGATITVIGPEKPWLDVENPEKRYAVHKTFLATLKSLEALGAFIALV